MHGRNWGFGHSRNSGRTAERVDEFVGCGFHNPILATIAIPFQAESCDIGNCYVEEDDFDDCMDGAEIKRLIKEQGATQKAIAHMLNLTEDKFSKALAGRRQFTVEEMDKLRRYFGVKAPSATTAPHLLPIVGLISAGSWREGFEQVMGWMPSPDPALSRDSFVVIVQGESMNMVAKDGEAVIVDPALRRLTAGKLYVIRNSSGDTTFKRYLESPARLEACSTVEGLEPIYLGDEQVEVIGQVRKRVSDL
jgi:repressor LexA